jgi:hypothetical protein
MPAAHAADSVPVVLQARQHADALKGRPITLRLKKIERPSDLEHGRAAVQVDARVGESVNTDLSPGYWSVETDGTSIWRSQQVIHVASPATYPIDIWPSAMLAGTISSDGGSALKELSIAFTRSPDGMGGPEKGEVRCPVSDGKFNCAVPAGTLDLRLHARSHVSRFFWHQVVNIDATVDLGKTILKQGQGVFGRVELARGVKVDLSKTVVQATPPAMGEGQQPLVAGGSMLVLSGTVTSDGAFQIDGLPPGPFTLTAHHPAKLYSEPVHINVRPGSEIQLLRPLRLAPPRRLELLIAPPADDAGRPWHVHVERYVSQRFLEEEVQSDATLAGSWTSPALQPGKFIVNITRGDGSIWHSESIEINDDTTVHVQLASMHVQGTVTIGGKPLQAMLTFHDLHGRSAKGKSDEAGKFKVVLPKSKEQQWNVVVQAEKPAVRKTVRNVTIKRSENGGATAEIEVPAIAITGIVVDKDGSPIPRGLVNVFKTDGSEGMMQAPIAQDGTFTLHGIGAGTYSVKAAAFDKESEPQSVDVTEDNPPAPLTLIVKDVKKLRGIIQSDLGPVAGARVWVFPTDASLAMSGSRDTDARGMFETFLPPGANEFDVVVAPPGFTYTIDHQRWEEGKGLVERVYQRGGTLTVPNDPALMIVHSGGITSARAILNEWPVRVESDALSSYTFDMMEPGAYSVCKVDAGSLSLFRATNGRNGGHCVEGFLPPNGSLKFEAPRIEPTK